MALLHYLDLAHLGDRLGGDESFTMLVPRAFAAKMRPGDEHDPLLRQVLPLALEEEKPSNTFTVDPLAEATANRAQGLLHKYQGRVLLIAAGACAVNCRYCFRRHYDYQHGQAGRDRWQEALDYIAADASIEEVILSGGDPLLLADSQLDDLMTKLEAIPHLRRLRIHSRLPLVIPDRITAGLRRRLRASRLQGVFVLHSNHARELDEAVARALGDLADAGLRLLNQSVLLRGVNDQVEVLSDLSTRLWDMHVQPYYLHLLDPVAGAAHFDIPEREALELYHGLCANNPGYLVPRLVREIPGEASKTPLGLLG